MSFKDFSIVDFPAPGSHQDIINCFPHFEASQSSRNFSIILSCNSLLVIKTSFSVIGSLYIAFSILSYSLLFSHVSLSSTIFEYFFSVSSTCVFSFVVFFVSSNIFLIPL
jgi:hypothetical protein